MLTQDLSPPAPITRQQPLSRAEKDAILQETIARQQKLMAKAQGIEIDSDNPAEVAIILHTTITTCSSTAAVTARYCSTGRFTEGYECLHSSMTIVAFERCQVLI